MLTGCGHGCFGHDFFAQTRPRREDAKIPSHVNARWRHQRRQATVTGAGATLRNLTITNDGTGRTCSAGLYINNSSATATLNAVKIVANGGQSVYGIHMDYGSYLWTYNSNILALNGAVTSFGVYANTASRPELHTTSAYASGAGGGALLYGMYFSGTFGFVEGCSLDGDGSPSDASTGLDKNGTGTLHLNGGQVGGFGRASRLGVAGSRGQPPAPRRGRLRPDSHRQHHWRYGLRHR